MDQNNQSHSHRTNWSQLCFRCDSCDGEESGASINIKQSKHVPSIPTCKDQDHPLLCHLSSATMRDILFSTSFGGISGSRSGSCLSGLSICCGASLVGRKRRSTDESGASPVIALP
mmetsp:Transcript_8064/g.29948  ORF Transcript_8064/g.29948 Transcript_8064/m.29948 type:complete len:116 (-) Transcript_8064:3662-4009(-)